jgi:hypothetical protein
MTADRIRQLTPGQYVYHPKCEVTKSGPVGIPSAHVFATKEGGLAFYCFNCCQTTFCMATWHMAKLAHFPDELINIKGHINEFAQDVTLSVRPMALQVVDAPTGSGKTELLASFCRSNPDISVLSITFRRSLSTMLSKRLGLNDYQSCNFESDPVKRRRLSICLDSVPRLPINECYDVVIIDEAGQVRYHFIGDTIAPKLDIVYRIIERILTNTKTTILVQFELLQTDLEFWASFAGIDVADRAACRRWVIESETFCPPMRYSESLEEVVYCLKKHYLDNWDAAAGYNRSPIVAFCNRVNTVKALLSYFQKEIAPNEQAASRIRGVWAAVQSGAWQSRYLADPNALASDCDILFLTPILQSGASLDCWFKMSFSFFFIGMTHRNQFQMQSRLRSRVDLDIPRYAFLQNGVCGRQIADTRAIGKAIAHMHIGGRMPASLRDTIAEYEAELADTANRNSYLWRQRFAKKPNDMWLIDELVKRSVLEKPPEGSFEEITRRLRVHGEDVKKDLHSSAKRHMDQEATLSSNDLQVEEVRQELVEIEAEAASKDMRMRIKCTSLDAEAVFKFVQKSITYGSPASNERQLATTYWLIALLEYAIHRKHGEADNDRWTLRQKYSEGMPKKFAEMCLCKVFYDIGQILHSENGLDQEYQGIFFGTWPTGQSEGTLYSRISGICASASAEWVLVFGCTWIKQSKTLNSARKIVKFLHNRFGLKSLTVRSRKRKSGGERVSTQCSKIDEEALCRSIALARCIVADDHYEQLWVELDSGNWGGLFERTTAIILGC